MRATAFPEPPRFTSNYALEHDIVTEYEAQFGKDRQKKKKSSENQAKLEERIRAKILLAFSTAPKVCKTCHKVLYRRSGKFGEWNGKCCGVNYK
eukprot:m.273751 g.273751  ORF g.273751 m.273751 type:complete len:94 (-) comp16126_c0_seq3:65-346(-)